MTSSYIESNTELVMKLKSEGLIRFGTINTDQIIDISDDDLKERINKFEQPIFIDDISCYKTLLGGIINMAYIIPGYENTIKSFDDIIMMKDCDEVHNLFKQLIVYINKLLADIDLEEIEKKQIGPEASEAKYKFQVLSPWIKTLKQVCNITLNWEESDDNKYPFKTIYPIVYEQAKKTMLTQDLSLYYNNEIS